MSLGRRILAIPLNEVRSVRLRRTLPTITYAPYFISVVIMVSMMMRIFSPNYGISTMVRYLFGLEPIDIPSLLPAATILLILEAGRMRNISFEKVILLQSTINLRTSEVLMTYVSKVGQLHGYFDLATAGGHGSEQLRVCGDREFVAVHDTHGNGGCVPVPPGSRSSTRSSHEGSFCHGPSLPGCRLIVKRSGVPPRAWSSLVEMRSRLIPACLQRMWFGPMVRHSS